MRAAAGAGWAALLLALLAPAVAEAQSNIPPPVRHMVDENGVDVTRAEHNIDVTDVSIGPQGGGGLAYVRQLRRLDVNHPYDLALFQSGSNWTASVGLRSYTFVQSGTIYTSTDGSGATLVESGAARILTLPDSTVIVYDYNVIDSLVTARKSRATSITSPSGDRVNLAWVSTIYCSNNSDGCSSGTLRTAVRLQAAWSPAGYQLHFNYVLAEAFAFNEYTLWKRLASITAINTTVDACDPFAHACTLTQSWPTAAYSSTGTQVTDPAGRVSSYTEDGTSLRIRRPGSTSDDVVYTYNGDAFIDSVTRDGMTWTYAYSVAGNVATMVVTDPGLHQRTIVSDLAVGLPTSVTNEVAQTTTYTYDASGRLRRATAPEDDYVEYTYDARGNVTTVRARDKAGNSANDIVTTAAYPASCTDPQTCNQPTSTTDARGNTTDYTYSTTHGGVLTVTAPAAPNGVRPQTRYTYTALTTAGSTTVYRVTTISQCQTLASCNGLADEAETVIAYAHPNLLASSVIRRNGTATLSAVETMTYDDVGNLLTVNGPLSGSADTVRTRYNLAREVTGTISPDPDGAGALEPRAQRITRSTTTGLVTRVETGTVNSQSDADWSTFAMLERVDFVYDTAERPIRQTLMGTDLVARAETELSYDNEGRPQCTAVRMNSAEYGSLPDDACVLDTAHATYGQDRITRTTYDAANRVTLVQTGYGVTGVQANEVATAYTANGRVFHVTDAEANRTTYEYDGHDRLVKTRYPSGTTDNTSSTIDYVQLTLDDNGNVTNVLLRNAQQQAAQNIGFTYDALNRLTQKDLPGTEPTVSYSYDNLNRMTGASQTGHALTFTYDALGRNLTQSGPLGTASYQYDLAGRRTRLTYPGSGLYVVYDYLVTGEVTAIRENNATSGIGVLATFGYDQLGRRTLLSRGNGTSTSYSYDPVSRLSQLVQSLPGTTNDLTLGFGYNPASQITSNTRSNNLYSYTDHANQDVDYTHNGRNELTNAGGTAVTYDTRRNITAIGTAAYTYNSENMLVSGGGITLAYDPLRRLYQASINRWAYDGGTMIAEYDTSNALLRRFVHGPGTDEPLVWYEGTGTSDRRFLHADERGSIIAASDSTGTVIGTNSYDEYGAPESPTTGRFQYTGQVWIASLGLYHYRARFYNPSIGRFMQTDPIGYGAGMNMYAYVGNDPVNATDPSGLYPKNNDPPLPPDCKGESTCPTTGTRLPGGCGSCMVTAFPGFASFISGGGPGGGGGGGGGSGSGGGGSQPLPGGGILVVGSPFSFGDFDPSNALGLPVDAPILVVAQSWRRQPVITLEPWGSGWQPIGGVRVSGGLFSGVQPRLALRNYSEVVVRYRFAAPGPGGGGTAFLGSVGLRFERPDSWFGSVRTLTGPAPSLWLQAHFTLPGGTTHVAAYPTPNTPPGTELFFWGR